MRSGAEEIDLWHRPPKRRSEQSWYKTIWRIANDLRGSVGGWTQVLRAGHAVLSFHLREPRGYLTRGEHEAGDAAFDYTQMPDSQADFARDEVVAEKGFFILPSDLFANVRERAAGDEFEWSAQRVFADVDVGAGLRTARTTSRVCSTTWMSTATSSAQLSPSRMESW